MNKNRLINEEITILLENSKDRFDFLAACPYKGNECGSHEPPSYCDKCYKEGKYNIKNGRSAYEFSNTEPGEIENNAYNKIVEAHNKKLANECEFKSENNTCKYKDYWEKCIYCKAEFSR